MRPERETKMGQRMKAKALSKLRGRRPWSEEEGRQVLDAWEASGDSVPTFARGAGLVPQRVYWWKERLGPRNAHRGALATRPAVTAFVPVTVRPAAQAVMGLRAPAITVVGRDGLRIEVAEIDATSAAWVAALVKTLREVRS